MLPLEENPASLLDLARNHLLATLRRHKKKPYLPVWGELFASLREIAREGERRQEDILIYPIHPSGQLWYMYQEKRFLADLPETEIRIALTLEQLIDSLIGGSFAPLPQSPERKKSPGFATWVRG